MCGVATVRVKLSIHSTVYVCLLNVVGQMCNTLIGRATDMLAGGEIFRFIEQDEHQEAAHLLETSLKVTFDKRVMAIMCVVLRDFLVRVM